MVKKIKPDIICLGYNQGGKIKNIRQDIKRHGLSTPLIRLKAFYPKKYKSRLLKRRPLA